MLNANQAALVAIGEGKSFFSHFGEGIILQQLHMWLFFCNE